MRRLVLVSSLCGLVAGTASAGTFSDDYALGLRGQYWTIVETKTGIYQWDAIDGALNFRKIGPNPGGLNHIAAYLNMDAFGGKIVGDFDVSVSFRNVVFDASTTGFQQVEMHTVYENGSYFFDVFSPEAGAPYAAHVWDGGFRGLIKTTANAGVFRIARSAGTMSGYLNGALIYSKSATTSPLNTIRLTLQNNASNNSDISCTFDDFWISGDGVTDRTNLLSGKVVLGDFLGDVTSRAIDLLLQPTGSGTPIEKLGVPLQADGSFDTLVYGLGEFDVFVTSRGFLRRLLSPPITLNGWSSQVSGIDAMLVNGDADGDNAVTVFDYILLSDAFDSSEGDPTWNSNADFDGDGAVTVFDYIILSNNFDLIGD